MIVHWLIDATAFEHYHDELAAAIVRHGHQVISINPPEPPYVWDDTGRSYRKKIPAGSCVITHGDIGLVTRVLADGDWLPGAFATINNYFCSRYFPTLGRFLLNRHYIMLPYGEMLRCESFLFDTLGRQGKLFVRPDSPLKLFTGTLITQATYARDVEYLGFYEFPSESLVVVSAPQAITREWRFLVVRGEVITGSLYKDGDNLQFSCPDFDPQAKEFAAEVAAAGFAPDPVWIMDVCQTAAGTFHLLEIGCFSFANLYGCNKDQVVAAVSRAAVAYWKTKA
jgi:hypothetical protein